MNSEYGEVEGGFPHSKSSDQSLFAAPQGYRSVPRPSSPQRQGIHRMLLRHLIALMIDVSATSAEVTDDQKDLSSDLSEDVCLPTTWSNGLRGRRWFVGTLRRPTDRMCYLLFTISTSADALASGPRISMTPNIARNLVEPDGIEPTTSSLQS